ncbi:hypothetical protein PoB_002651800 [Plakobranchus ocellatus]|uniref:Uncharacterized protein n=1 Tax=Plakobranchus ocellatus TaxID=259542 RepID=A0AAV4A024_9GAST|nr:hypothetical protein PoB_002651800 [Plakobranchus ocellatus]
MSGGVNPHFSLPPDIRHGFSSRQNQMVKCNNDKNNHDEDGGDGGGGDDDDDDDDDDDKDGEACATCKSASFVYFHYIEHYMFRKTRKET